MFKNVNAFVAIIFSLFASTLQADVVFTSNGDKFVGHISEFDGQLLKIDMLSASMLTIEAKWITSFATDQTRAWEIRGVRADIKMETATTDGYVMIDNQLIAVNDLRLRRHALPKKVSGNVELGWDMESDGDRKRELRLKAELHYHLNKWRHETNGEVKRGELHGVPNEDVLEFNYTPDYLISPHWLITLDSSYREEGVDTVSYYSHIGVGPG